MFYVMKVKFMHDSIQEVRRNPFVTVSFQFAIFWTEMEHAALSFALFFATFKNLHSIRLNPQLQILVWSLAIAKNDIFFNKCSLRITIYCTWAFCLHGFWWLIIVHPLVRF